MFSYGLIGLLFVLLVGVKGRDKAVKSMEDIDWGEDKESKEG